MSKKKKNKKKKDEEPVEELITEPTQEAPEKEPPFKYDEYWLKWAKNSLDNTIPVLHKRIQLFYNYINVISASTLVGTTVLATLTGTKDLLAFVLVFLAIIVMQFGRFFIGIKTAKPDYESLDLRSPIQINKAHNNIVASLKERLDNGQKALFWISLLYIGLVGGALYRSNTLKVAKPTAPSIEISKDQVQIIGQFKEDKDLKLLFIGDKIEVKIKDTLIDNIVHIDTTKITKADTLISAFKVAKSQPINYHYHIKNLPFTLKKATLIYKDDNVVKMIENEIKKE